MAITVPTANNAYETERDHPRPLEEERGDDQGQHDNQENIFPKGRGPKRNALGLWISGSAIFGFSKYFISYP